MVNGRCRELHSFAAIMGKRIGDRKGVPEKSEAVFGIGLVAH